MAGKAGRGACGSEDAWVARGPGRSTLSQPMSSSFSIHMHIPVAVKIPVCQVTVVALVSRYAPPHPTSDVGAADSAAARSFGCS
jgi:hypothetical protein